MKKKKWIKPEFKKISFVETTETVLRVSMDNEKLFKDQYLPPKN